MSPEYVHRFTVPEEARGERVDLFLGKRVPDVSRERVKKSIRGGACLLDGRPCPSPSVRLAPGQEIELTLAAKPRSLRPEAGELRLVYRDETLAVIDKPAGLVVHPCPSCGETTLAHRLAAHFPELARMEGERPGIVHRLDRDTSGLMVVALTESSRQALVRGFAEREVRKEYLTLARGVPEAAVGDISEPLGRHPAHRTKMAVLPENRGGKAARSRYEVLYADPGRRFSLLRVRIFTGRTHQIRVHLAHIGHPVRGDVLYGPKTRDDLSFRQMLHSHRLAFSHPASGETLDLRSPPPPDFLRAALVLAGRTRMIVIVGAPGSGKSSLLRLLGELGLPCFNADATVHELYGPGGDGRHLLRQRFGDRFVPHENAPVDRAALLGAVHADPGLLRELEAMIHPLVRHELRKFLQQAEAAGASCAAAEIPLYLESGMRKHVSNHKGNFDEKSFPAPLLVGVRCDERTRGIRLKARGLRDAERAALERRQWPQERKLAACELVLDNGGPPEKLREEALKLLARLRELRAKDEAELAARLAALWT
jgi:23S rRNA pseudouridine1911/1915/1917 synthase